MVASLLPVAQPGLSSFMAVQARLAQSAPLNTEMRVSKSALPQVLKVTALSPVAVYSHQFCPPLLAGPLKGHVLPGMLGATPVVLPG